MLGGGTTTSKSTIAPRSSNWVITVPKATPDLGPEPVVVDLEYVALPEEHCDLAQQDDEPTHRQLQPVRVVIERVRGRWW